ncbi:hypothetical protein [Pasteurella multocida]|uniref:hypothetical protein n=1 Tax=Pasteurella multocida TaxID=747 RepID=UPI00187BF506|nr:hypothetical protein [Pasteurella multocida]
MADVAALVVALVIGLQISLCFRPVVLPFVSHSFFCITRHSRGYTGNTVFAIAFFIVLTFFTFILFNTTITATNSQGVRDINRRNARTEPKAPATSSAVALSAFTLTEFTEAPFRQPQPPFTTFLLH